jgi:PAS domain S-box-containing protein
MTHFPQAHTDAATPAADPLLHTAVTDLGAALEALAAVERELAAASAARVRLAALLDLLPDTCLLTDAAGVIHETNRATSSLIGHARRYVLTKPLASFVAPAGQAPYARALASLAQATDERPSTLTLPFRPRRSGPPLTVCAWVRPLSGVGGLERALLWLLRDVSAETELAAAYTQLQAGQAQALRTRTMELEAVLRMKDATLAALLERATMATADPPATVLAGLVAGLRDLVGGRPALPRVDEPQASR